MKSRVVFGENQFLEVAKEQERKVAFRARPPR